MLLALHSRGYALITVILSALVCVSLQAAAFRFPTPNRALLEAGGEERFYTPTVGKTWVSGTFGCVRTDGRQMHEGLDIRATKRDRQGEATDAVLATAAGVVAYVNRTAGLSNYGRYIVLRHQIEGLEIYSTYAHLKDFPEGLKVGSRVNAGQVIGTLGRTSNTRSGISKERAHLHFEIGLFLSDRYNEWKAKNYPGQRNDHGPWNGQNLIGLDPAYLLIQSHRNPKFSLLQHIRTQTEFCRILVRDNSFPWLKRYPLLIRRNPVAEKQGAIAYEIGLNFNGVPFVMTPRAASEIPLQSARYRVISVNAIEAEKHVCRRLVKKSGQEWILTKQSTLLLDLLTQ